MVMNWASIIGNEFLLKLLVIPTVLCCLFLCSHVIKSYFKIKNKYLIFAVYSLNFFVWIVILRMIFHHIDPSFKQNFLVNDMSLILVAIVLSYLLNNSFNYTEYSLIPTLVMVLLLYTSVYGFSFRNFLLILMAFCLFWFVIRIIYKNKNYISKQSWIMFPIIALSLDFSVTLIDYTTINFAQSTFIINHTKFTFLQYFVFVYLKMLALLFFAQLIFIVVNNIISEYNLMKQRIYIDDLTQVYNRRKFEEVLRELIENDYHSEFSLVLFDIDSFKYINDTYGHNSGDYVLKNLCVIVKEILKVKQSNAQLFRYGGDEFFLIFKNSEKGKAEKVMKMISREIALRTFEYRGHYLKTSISSGILDITEEVNYSDVLFTIDEKLYEAKHRGKNQVFY